MSRTMMRIRATVPIPMYMLPPPLLDPLLLFDSTVLSLNSQIGTARTCHGVQGA